MGGWLDGRVGEWLNGRDGSDDSVVMAVMSEFEVIMAENTHPNVPVTVAVSLTQ